MAKFKQTCKRQHTLRPRSAPKENDSDSFGSSDEVDFELEPTMPTSNMDIDSETETRPRAANVVDGVVEKLRRAKIAEQKDSVVVKQDLSKEPIEIPEVDMLATPEEPSKRRQEVDAYRRATVGVHSISANNTQPALSQFADTLVHRGVRTDVPVDLNRPVPSKPPQKADTQTHRNAAVDSAVHLRSVSGRKVIKRPTLHRIIPPVPIYNPSTGRVIGYQRWASPQEALRLKLEREAERQAILSRLQSSQDSDCDLFDADQAMTSSDDDQEGADEERQSPERPYEQGRCRDCGSWQHSGCFALQPWVR